jgi:hypothetical protein
MRGPALGVIASMLIAAASPAAAETLVTFIHPETFTDAALDGGHGAAARQPALTVIADYLRGLGTEGLGPHRTLAIEITDIDLAGQFEPWRVRADDVRIMRDVYPPRIALRYTLTDNGAVVARGEDRLVDVNYLANADARLAGDPLRYEKAMLRTWFRHLPLTAGQAAGTDRATVVTGTAPGAH